MKYYNCIANEMLLHYNIYGGEIYDKYNTGKSG